MNTKLKTQLLKKINPDNILTDMASNYNLPYSRLPDMKPSAKYPMSLTNGGEAYLTGTAEQDTDMTLDICALHILTTASHSCEEIWQIFHIASRPLPCKCIDFLHGVSLWRMPGRKP